ncbi:hypothetical protein ABIB62_004755 [Mucilaginibacter sp. UYP25]|uniref:hypothetical protein n=1 Tax=unclassified Mucilaginibacter TaxID=2617802 RepID=UPI003392FAEE
MGKGFFRFIISQCDHPHDIQPDHLKKYLEYLHERPNQTAAGAISLNYIRKHLEVIRKFSRYLMESGQPSFTVKLRIKGKSTNIKSILTSNNPIASVNNCSKYSILSRFSLSETILCWLHFTNCTCNVFIMKSH